MCCYLMEINGHLMYYLIPCYMCNKCNYKTKKSISRWSKMASDFPF